MVPLGFIRPCGLVLVGRPPAGPDWWHEVKHDGFRMLGFKAGERVKLVLAVLPFPPSIVPLLVSLEIVPEFAIPAPPAPAPEPMPPFPPPIAPLLVSDLIVPTFDTPAPPAGPKDKLPLPPFRRRSCRCWSAA